VCYSDGGGGSTQGSACSCRAKTVSLPATGAGVCLPKEVRGAEVTCKSLVSDLGIITRQIML
jgi:hypothetical protein